MALDGEITTSLSELYDHNSRLYFEALSRGISLQAAYELATTQADEATPPNEFHPWPSDTLSFHLEWSKAPQRGEYVIHGHDAVDIMAARNIPTVKRKPKI